MFATFVEAAEVEDVPQGSDVFLSVIETIGTQAVPLPRDLLTGRRRPRPGSSTRPRGDS
ncbi:hypothetical protein [Actinomadura rudentiformis]|uniref:hypothetical protein n=1 Tax=Actinomadura rudentiformis TaxID=359158 RepID=UPI00178C6D9F|nr:hypothetical protein [Actinomadura rudentiformis]